MKKIFDIEFTLEELKIIDIALASSSLRHDISYDSMRSRRSDLTERWKTAEELRDKIAQIIDINTL